MFQITSGKKYRLSWYPIRLNFLLGFVIVVFIPASLGVSFQGKEEARETLDSESGPGYQTQQDLRRQISSASASIREFLSKGLF
jgi:hypothetical protein